MSSKRKKNWEEEEKQETKNTKNKKERFQFSAKIEVELFLRQGVFFNGSPDSLSMKEINWDVAAWNRQISPTYCISDQLKNVWQEVGKFQAEMGTFHP